jgi:hypothetical protein
MAAGPSIDPTMLKTLDPGEFLHDQLELALEREPEVVPQLLAVLRRSGADSQVPERSTPIRESGRQ